MRLLAISIILMCSVQAFAQSHDFEVRDFHENVSDMSAILADVRDGNGATTALLRFAVRDTLFEFEPNMGVTKLERKAGEVLLYVPNGTKRMTIRHPVLGILREYAFPAPLKSKTTYDAEIFITNEMYVQQLITSPSRPVVTTPPPFEENDTPIVETPEETPFEPQLPIANTQDPAASLYANEATPPASKGTGIHFLLNGGYNFGGLSGINFGLGLELGVLYIAADYTICSDKVEGIGINYSVKGYVKELGEAYDYKVSRFTARIGLNPTPNDAFQVVPQIGASFNMIKGDEIVNKLGSDSQFSESNPMSLSIALGIRIRLYAPLFLSVTPQYDFFVGKDEIYKVIKDSDKKIKSWCEGFGVNVGLLLRF